MIVSVADIRLSTLGKQAALVMPQAQKSVPLRPDGAAPQGSTLPDLMNLPEIIAGWFFQKRLLQSFNHFTDFLRRREIVIDDSINQGIRQIIIAKKAGATSAFPEAITYRLKYITARLLLKRK